MKLLKVFCAFLFLSGTNLTAQAQTPALSQSGADMNVNIQSLVQGRPASLPSGSADTKGSPYAIDQWLTGRLRLASNVRLAPLPLKYDVLNRRLLMRENYQSRDSLQLNDTQVVSFALDEPATPLAPARTRLFQRFTDSPDVGYRSAYAEILHQGRYTLLKVYAKRLIMADYQSPYGANRRENEIENRQLYFLRRPDASVVPVKLNLRALMAAAPDLAAKLAQASPTPKTDADWTATLSTADATK